LIDVEVAWKVAATVSVFVVTDATNMMAAQQTNFEQPMPPGSVLVR